MLSESILGESFDFVICTLKKCVLPCFWPMKVIDLQLELIGDVSLHQDELKLALKQGTTLLGCIKEQASRSEEHQLSPDELENQTTVERWEAVAPQCVLHFDLQWPCCVWPCLVRLLAQLDETENAFEQFWSKHQLKLEQCLQLRHFEQDFREVGLNTRGSARAAKSFHRKKKVKSKKLELKTKLNNKNKVLNSI